MESGLYVYVDLDSVPRLAGSLHTRVERGRERAHFEYARQWLNRPEARLCAPLFALPPLPAMTGGNMPLFGALGDSAPDRWGRTLMRRAERRRAGKKKRAPRILHETDFLLGIDDEVRAGSLRFARRKGGPFLGNEQRGPLPTLRDLPRLLTAVQAHERGRETASQSDLLLVSGQLLGGSRPKASVSDAQGRLLVAKFPSRDDEHDMQRWEALTLTLATRCGIRVPPFRLASVSGERVLLLARFDRALPDGRRVPFISAMGLFGAHDNEESSYLALADRIRAISANPKEDVAELWKRALFSMLVSNKDDHLRNHGMLLTSSGWRLSPAYDLNPEPQKLRPRIHLLSIDGVDDRASLPVLMSVASRFGLAHREARATARSYGEVIRRWRDLASSLRLPAKEIHDVRGAFEHEDLGAALRA